MGQLAGDIVLYVLPCRMVSDEANERMRLWFVGELIMRSLVHIDNPLSR